MTTVDDERERRAQADAANDDDDGTRLDRELNELLQELRVVLPGIQVLFAFLLAVPFAQRFVHVTDGDRRVFFAAFIATALSSILLMAPTVHHRLRWRQRDKERLLETANRMAIAGTALLAFAIDAVIYLVADVLYGETTAIVATAVVGAAFVVIWLLSPFMRALRDSKRD